MGCDNFAWKTISWKLCNVSHYVIGKEKGYLYSNPASLLEACALRNGSILYAIKESNIKEYKNNKICLISTHTQNNLVYIARNASITLICADVNKQRISMHAACVTAVSLGTRPRVRSCRHLHCRTPTPTTLRSVILSLSHSLLLALSVSVVVRWKEMESLRNNETLAPSQIVFVLSGIPH